MIGDIGRKALMQYAPAWIGGAVWAFAKFPEQLEWARDLYGKAFGYLAGLYEDWTQVEGYGEALHAAIGDLPGAPDRILDLATGTGYAARALKGFYPSSEVVGVDVSPEMVAAAQHLAVADGVQVRFEVADNASLPYDDDSFDLVVMQNSIPYPEEMMRVTAPGGQSLTVVSFAGPWVALAWPALAKRFEAAGARSTHGRQGGLGFYGVAAK